MVRPCGEGKGEGRPKSDGVGGAEEADVDSADGDVCRVLGGSMSKSAEAKSSVGRAFRVIFFLVRELGLTFLW